MSTAEAWAVSTLWPAVWGNLAANVIWGLLFSIPVSLVGSHFIVRHHTRKVHHHIERATGVPRK